MMPIFITRLVDESGGRITGGRATAGSLPASAARRSCTSWRARIRSVPSSKISTTDDRPSTDFERIVFSQGVPLRAFSSGMLIRLSTSSVDRPGASVWISTSGGANSGKTSSGVVCSVRMPKTMSRIDSASTTTRSRNEVETSQVMLPLFREAELGAEQFHRPGRDDLRPLGWPRSQDGHTFRLIDVADIHAAADVRLR